MTDGVQRVFGMEYRPIKQLEVLGPAGLKVGYFHCNLCWQMNLSEEDFCISYAHLVPGRNVLFKNIASWLLKLRKL